ncbi:MAG: hypothetical protein JXJ22_08500 [Bacteroidales bacterium]|nr:hypothetical protein [Bacteroidales bacterium]
MGETRWSEIIYDILEKNKNQISHNDFKFYNIARFPVIAKSIEQHAIGCRMCADNKNTFLELAENLPDYLNLSMESRKNFEKSLHAITDHLKKSHKVQFVSYYLSLFSAVGILSGIVLGILLSIVIKNLPDMNIILIGAGIGLITGRIWGSVKERKTRQQSGKI